MTQEAIGDDLKEKSRQDPVCGSPVDPDRAPRALENGREFFFCSETCQKRFKENPAVYIGSSPNL
jgi:Cu+-exporting ATPase